MIGFFFFKKFFVWCLHFYNADWIQAVLLNTYPDQGRFRGAEVELKLFPVLGTRDILMRIPTSY
jgi:hypothetical protein